MNHQDNYNAAMDKLRDELATAKGGQIALLGEGLTAMLQRHPEWAGMILEKERTIKGALDAVRKNAVGGCSDPVRTTKSLIEYYKLPCTDARRLALEVTTAMMGEGDGGTTSSVTAQRAAPPSPEGEGFGGTAATVDLFDLDALIAFGEAELSPSTPAVPGETRDAKRGGAIQGVM